MNDVMEEAPPLGSRVGGPEFLTMRETAALLGMSYWWLSRRWKLLGLRARRVGLRKLCFKREEVLNFIDKKIVPTKIRGRPKKVLTIYAEGKGL